MKEGIRSSAEAAGHEWCESSKPFSVLCLVLATRNPHKTREFAEILGTDFALSDLTQTKIPIVEETGSTFEENAILKAVATSRAIPGLVVADDSGLEVTALGGAPGVYSARYAGEEASDQDNVAKLLGALDRIKPSGREARFCCAIALARGGKTLAVFHGAIKGAITSQPRGKTGFGYDPVFIPERYELTFAELGAAAKNRDSHRAKAVTQLREYLTPLGP